MEFFQPFSPQLKKTPEQQQKNKATPQTNRNKPKTFKCGHLNYCNIFKKQSFLTEEQDLFWLMLLAMANELFLVSSLVQLSHTIMKVPYFKQMW